MKFSQFNEIKVKKYWSLQAKYYFFEGTKIILKMFNFNFEPYKILL